jgi:Methyltransferase FkbM domain
MDLANYNPRMLNYLIEQSVFATEPFVLYDVGCAGGIDSLWRLFGDQLAGVGFDPRQDEIQRLCQKEKNPNIAYVATMIGLDDKHEFHQHGRQLGNNFYEYFHFFERTSAAAAARSGAQEQGTVLEERLTSVKISISDYARTSAAKYVDFIKIDTDGHDLEAALSAEDMIKPCGVLGFMIETPFTGAYHDTENSFHNIDRLMRRSGFMPYTFALRRYSRAALPARFVYNLAAQTVTGQVRWADTIYLRDGASSQYVAFWGKQLEPTAALKLACLYELFGIPDCAAELLIIHRACITQVADVDRLLDLLTPSVDGVQLNYAQFIQKFTADPAFFFPRII